MSSVFSMRFGCVSAPDSSSRYMRRHLINASPMLTQYRGCACIRTDGNHSHKTAEKKSEASLPDLRHIITFILLFFTMVKKKPPLKLWKMKLQNETFLF